MSHQLRHVLPEGVVLKVLNKFSSSSFVTLYLQTLSYQHNNNNNNNRSPVNNCLLLLSSPGSSRGYRDKVNKLKLKVLYEIVK